jgi:hypothetical protein
VLENDDFVAWTNENCLCVVGHNGAVHGEDHKPVEVTDPKTKEKKSTCPKYLGLTCEEHQAVQADAQNPKDGVGKITMPGGVPATFMVGPDGAVEQMDQAKSQGAKSAIDELVAYQKKYDGKPIPSKKYEAYKKLFADGDTALEAGKWKDALSALVKVDADGKKLSKGLVEKVKAKADALSEKAKAKFDELKDGDGDPAAKLKAVKALRADLSTKLSTGALAVVADLDAWIKEQATTPAAPAAK